MEDAPLAEVDEEKSYVTSDLEDNGKESEENVVEEANSGAQALSVA